MTAKATILACIMLFGTVHISSAQASEARNAGVDQGIERFQAGDLSGSRAHLEKALEADSENHAALFFLGRIALQEEHLDEAIDWLKGAVALNGSDSVYRTWLGRAYIAKLQTVSFFAKGTLAGRALEQLQEAVKLDPTNVEARVSLAGYYANAPSIAGGSKKKARQQLEHIVEYEPIRAKSILAGLLIKDEEYDEAIVTLAECIEAEPAELEHRYRLGALYQRLERFDAAFDTFEDVLDIAPGDSGALYQLGRTAVLSSTNLERGIECLRAYLENPVKPGYPGHDAAHWRLGMLFEHMGDRGLAQKEYEAALVMNPEEEKYRDALKELERN